MATARSSEFTPSQVKKVSEFIQNYLKANNLNDITADDAADLLARHRILSNQIGPKPGFNFRQMLRDGREGLIDKVEGVFQERPRTKWYIKKVK
jgi:hypothetical protein